MKEMKYQKERKIELLDKGKCCGYDYYILNLGTHPTAYINIPKVHSYYEKSYWDIELPVHGGLTYGKNSLMIGKDKEIKGWFLGWDYAHCDDYTGDMEMYPEWFKYKSKKWKTEEIQEEVYKACERLERIKY